MTESLVLYNHSIREILILYIILLSVNCFVSLRKKRGPEMLRTWKVDGFNILYLGCHSRTEATVRHKDIPSCQIWKIANRKDSDSFEDKQLPSKKKLPFFWPSCFPHFCCSCLSVCWSVFAISQNPKEDRKGLESQWYIGISYIGDQRSGMGLGTQKQKFK